jgi:hypothetical protein
MKTGKITLYENETPIESRDYESFRERIKILEEWRGKGTHYQISPSNDHFILPIHPRTLRAKLLLKELNTWK